MRRNVIICLVLWLVTLAVYWPVRHYDFVNFDDPIVLIDNPNVNRGLSRESVRWAFTNGLEGDFYYPLTWLRPR